MAIWNPWHGCHKISPGCRNCYVYRRDESIGKDAGIVAKTGDYDLPRKRNRKKEYKLQPAEGHVYTCMTSDFFLEDADEWREECWKMIRERKDLSFVIITKRIHRFMECIPDDWGDGYPNVMIYCTVENQKMADYRLPIFLNVPVRWKGICHEPMLGPVDIAGYLSSGQISYVLCGGESGPDARPCHYEWILSTRDQCIKYDVSFHFKQTGAVFVKNGKIYHIDRKFQHDQAAKAGIDYSGTKPVITVQSENREITDKFGEQMELFELARQIENEKPLTNKEWIREDLFERIAASNFRSRFKLSADDKEYVREKGFDIIRRHAEDFVSKRLAPARIPNDGKQTPMRGHPVFRAQHACACCCRACLEKWHGIKAGTELTEEQQKYVVDILMEWIRRQM